MAPAKWVNDYMVEEAVVEYEWCAVAFMMRESAPCEHFEPEFKAFSDLTPLPIVCVFIDIDENPALAEELLVDAAPTVLLFFSGEEVGRFEGPYSREAMSERMGKIVSGRKA